MAGGFAGRVGHLVPHDGVYHLHVLLHLGNGHPFAGASVTHPFWALLPQSLYSLIRPLHQESGSS